MYSLFIPSFSSRIWNKSGKFPFFEAFCLYLGIGAYFLQNKSYNLIVDKIPLKCMSSACARPNTIAARHDFSSHEF